MKNLSEAFDLGTKFFGENSGSPLASGNITNVSSIVSLFLNIAFVLSGIILLFFFILGGIGLIGGAGQDNPQKAEQSKKTITSAVIGFVIVFASYWIVKLVGQLLGMPDII